MSKGNGELIRRAYQAYANGQLATMLEFIDPALVDLPGSHPRAPHPAGLPRPPRAGRRAAGLGRAGLAGRARRGRRQRRTGHGRRANPRNRRPLRPGRRRPCLQRVHRARRTDRRPARLSRSAGGPAPKRHPVVMASIRYHRHTRISPPQSLRTLVDHAQARRGDHDEGAPLRPAHQHAAAKDRRRALGAGRQHRPDPVDCSPCTRESALRRGSRDPVTGHRVAVVAVATVRRPTLRVRRPTGRRRPPRSCRSAWRPGGRGHRWGQPGFPPIAKPTQAACMAWQAAEAIAAQGRPPSPSWPRPRSAGSRR
jgi:hypothetical protein